MLGLDQYVSRLLDNALRAWQDSETAALRAGVEAACASLGGELEREGGMAAGEAASYVAAVVQLAIRGLLLRELATAGKGLRSAGALVDLAVALALHAPALAAPELPFLLLEDLFMSIPAGRLGAAWEMVEQRIEVLTSPQLMPLDKTTKAKMAMLRVANYLLRRLSPAHHTALCGRVMMFLAYAFELSERSGVNLLGAFNEGNVTEVEDAGAFLSSERDAAGAEDATRKLLLEQGADDSGGGPAVNYALYARFWELQRFFVARFDRSPAGCASSAQQWEHFSEVADVVLTAFESKPFSPADLERETAAQRSAKRRRRDHDHDHNGGGSGSAGMDLGQGQGLGQSGAADAFFPIKYLSSSRLLRLQLADPMLRRNVLVQFAVLCSSLAATLESSSGNNNTTGAAATATSQLQPAVRAKLQDNAHGLERLRARVWRQLRATPPDGDSFTACLEHELSRERGWEAWKQLKCPNFERQPSGEPLAEAGGAGREQQRARESARASTHQRAVAKVKRNRSLWRYDIEAWNEDLSQAAGNPTPKFDDFIKPMEEALDPDNCIEDEYHPRHDAVYCWRGFRLLARNNVDAMGNVQDGSLAAAVKLLRGIVDKPVEPAPMELEGSSASAADDSGDADAPAPTADVGGGSEYRAGGEGESEDEREGEREGEGEGEGGGEMPTGADDAERATDEVDADADAPTSEAGDAPRSADDAERAADEADADADAPRSEAGDAPRSEAGDGDNGNASAEGQGYAHSSEPGADEYQGDSGKNDGDDRATEDDDRGDDDRGDNDRGDEDRGDNDRDDNVRGSRSDEENVA